MSLSTLHVFEVLWTTNLTQKRKKWNDGTLKFHILNRRAVLYDENEVYVADLFVNKPDLALEDELLFERVLVTIEQDVGFELVEHRPSPVKKPTPKRQVLRREVPNTSVPLSQIIANSASKSSRSAIKRSTTAYTSNTRNDISPLYIKPSGNSLSLDFGQSILDPDPGYMIQPRRMPGPTAAAKSSSVLQLEMELSQTLDILEEANRADEESSSPVAVAVPEVDLLDIIVSDSGSESGDIDIGEISLTPLAPIDSSSQFGPWSREAFDLFDS